MTAASVPENEALLEAMRAARGGTGSLQTVISHLVRSILFLPSATNPADTQAGGVQPVLFPVNGVSFLAVFTSLEASKAVSDIAEYSVALSGAQILRGVMPGAGLVVNPGSDEGFQIDPDSLQAIVTKMPADL
ncbi:MAG: hypothetical protein JWP75_1653 [Frondihabitans sp.]|nr:hypothetical protein [Frondihabitans sp.]